MPRYFFHRTDGDVENDPIGTELANVSAARKHAVVFAGETLSKDPEHLWLGGEFYVEVTDEKGKLLFTIETKAIDNPALNRQIRI